MEKNKINPLEEVPSWKKSKYSKKDAESGLYEHLKDPKEQLRIMKQSMAKLEKAKLIVCHNLNVTDEDLKNCKQLEPFQCWHADTQITGISQKKSKNTIYTTNQCWKEYSFPSTQALFVYKRWCSIHRLGQRYKSFVSQSSMLET